MKNEYQMNKLLGLLLILIFVFISSSLKGQTLFESAKDDGIIAFSKERISQIKINLSSTAITYGYYYVSGNSIYANKLLINGEFKAKPNDNGIATIAKEGKLQPSIQGNLSIGDRFNDVLLPKNWTVLDVYLKGEYRYNEYSIFDSTRINVSDAFYKINKNTFNLNLLLNFGIALGKTNLFAGGQIGISKTNNSDDLDKGSVEKIQNYSSYYLIKDVEEVKIGQLKNITKYPLKIDMLFDPGLQLNSNDKTNTRLGIFGYYRTDVNIDKPKNRLGFGICLIDSQNPSRIFSSLGFELPKFGSGVTKTEKEKDYGIVFVSIGYTIF
jgi:hypothetical protein